MAKTRPRAGYVQPSSSGNDGGEAPVRDGVSSMDKELSKGLKFTGCTAGAQSCSELPEEVWDKIINEVPYLDLTRNALLAKVWKSARDTRLIQARYRMSKSSLGDQFISAIGLAIFRFLSNLDMLTGRADVAVPVLHVDNEGRLFLSNKLEPRGLAALLFITAVTPGMGLVPHLHASICLNGMVVADIMVGRLPAKVVIVVRGEQSLLQPALSAAILASITAKPELPAAPFRPTEMDKKVKVLLQEELPNLQDYEVSFRDIALEDDMLHGSSLLCHQFVAGSILVMPRVGGAFKLMRLRFLKRCDCAVRDGVERDESDDVDLPPPLEVS
eukprot:jgi/Botrbrau1/19633/Bobra.0003s0003.1